MSPALRAASAWRRVQVEAQLAPRPAWTERSPRCRPLELERRLWARPAVVPLAPALEPAPLAAEMRSRVRPAAIEERARAPEHELERERERAPEHELEWAQAPERERALLPAA